MKRVNQMGFYRLGNLTRLREMRVGDTKYAAFTTYSIILLRGFINDIEAQQTVPTAVEKGRLLFDAIKTQLNNVDVISQSVINYIESLLSTFETSLEDDLARLPTYNVEQVGAYSHRELITHADAVFPLNMRDGSIIPSQALLDFRSAGGCLAFDLPTACGFHVFRATDAMLRKYCEHFQAIPKGNGRDWGRYIGALRDKTSGRIPNTRTVELLDSIRNLDRNPVVHPELDLDKNMALAMFDMCKSAITLMAMDIRSAP